MPEWASSCRFRASPIADLQGGGKGVGAGARAAALTLFPAAAYLGKQVPPAGIGRDRQAPEKE